VVPADVAKERAELRERCGIHSVLVLLETVAGAGLQLLETPPFARHADDGHVEMPAADHRLERGEDVLVGEVTRRAEQHERIRSLLRFRHVGFSTWPPNWWRSADRILLANSSSPREAKRPVS